MIEIIGYAASVLIAISITIKGGFYFRILNMAGSICFFIYGLSIGSWPVAIINIYGTGINIFHLIREKKKRSHNKQPSYEEEK
jgi:hypothetical protein